MELLNKKFGPTAQKVLLLLMAGIALGLTTSPKRYFHILKTAANDWKRINRRALHHAIKNLYRSRLIDVVDNKDGSTTIILTQRGRKKALTYQIDHVMTTPMKRWDKKWRLVIFDIPERYKKARDALARTLKRMGFYQLQKSVFVHPFECDDEIDFVVEFFNLRPYVRRIRAEHIDNELHLKKLFSALRF